MEILSISKVVFGQENDAIETPKLRVERIILNWTIATSFNIFFEHLEPQSENLNILEV